MLLNDGNGELWLLDGLHLELVKAFVVFSSNFSGVDGVSHGCKQCCCRRSTKLVGGLDGGEGRKRWLWFGSNGGGSELRLWFVF